MAAAMAGSRGGTRGRAASDRTASFVLRLLDGDVSFDEFRTRLSAEPVPRTVTLVVNNACNLQCAHCYLQVERLVAPPLRPNEWNALFDSVVSAGPELVCLSGKEVFVGDRGAALLTDLRRACDAQRSEARIGLITNGTLVGPHQDTILAAAPSYFDISLDGVEVDHDAVRGEGAFALAVPNVTWAAATFSEHFFVSFTFQKQNHERLVGAIALYRQLGVQNVSLGFYRPLSYTASHLALTDEDIEQAFLRLETLSDLPSGVPTRVLLDLDLAHPAALTAFLRSDWFDPDHVEEDENGETFVEHVLSNGVTLTFRFTPYPAGVWKSVRITPEGLYLAAEDTLDTTHYAARSFGNVRDFDFDFAALHAHALASPRFEGILRDYYYRTLPELRAAIPTLPVRMAA